jgi:hypothetical protein
VTRPKLATRRPSAGREERLLEAIEWVEDKLEKELACREHTLRACIEALRRARRPPQREACTRRRDGV